MAFRWCGVNHYQEAVKNGAWFDVSKRGKIEVTGDDQITFLPRMLTNDIESLKPNQSTYACFLTPQGKVVTDAHVFRFEKSVWLDMEAGLAPKVIEALGKFVIADDVELKDKTQDFAGLLLFGPKARVYLQMLTKSSGHPDKINEHLCSSINKTGCHLFCIPLFGKRAWYVVTPMSDKNALVTTIQQSAGEFDMHACSDEVLEILRVQAGTPRYGVDFDQESLLMEVGIDKTAVSFTKGCYPGQEIVARMESRARFAKKLTGIVLEGTVVPKAGSEIQKSGKAIGKITSAVLSPVSQKPLALGYVTREHLKTQNKVEVLMDGQTVAGALKLLPFEKA